MTSDPSIEAAVQAALTAMDNRNFLVTRGHVDADDIGAAVAAVLPVLRQQIEKELTEEIETHERMNGHERNTAERELTAAWLDGIRFARGIVRRGVVDTGSQNGN